MAVLLGKWTTEARQRMNQAIAEGLLPDAEYTLGRQAEGTHYVIAYMRPAARSTRSGTTSFFAVNWESDTVNVTPIDAIPRDLAVV